MRQVDMSVRDVSVAPNAHLSLIEADFSGHVESPLWNGYGEVRLRLFADAARTLRDMLTDCIDRQDAGGHYPEVAE